MKKEEICPYRINIANSTPRHEIVKIVVNTFISFEFDKKEKGKVFKYKVETLPDNQFLYIVRPGHKKNFDFKVEVKKDFGLCEGKHTDLAYDLKIKKEENKENFMNLFCGLSEIYKCRENNVDKILENRTYIRNFSSGSQVEILLKVIKWLFIMEDIIYWDNEGRAFLYNYFWYTIETNNIEEINKPDVLKRYMKRYNIPWISCEE